VGVVEGAQRSHDVARYGPAPDNGPVTPSPRLACRVAAPGRAVTIDPSLAALRDAVEQEPFS
jgi:hypothetical protein